jgi:hypothetical protein
MRSRVIRQSISDDSLFRVINSWCREGAGQKKCRLRFLSAFASGGGIGAIAPLLDIFLADGNTLEIIIGVDRNGTDRGALRHLNALTHAYPSQCKVSIFNAPARNCIFHPKLYIFEAPQNGSVIIGSSNLTAGGLASNFESLIHFEECDSLCAPVQHAEEIWAIFAKPLHPLQAQFLKPLTPDYFRSLLAKLPEKLPRDSLSEASAFKVLWRPFSRVPFPRSTRPKQRKHTKLRKSANKYLIMDVLTETRNTQMQVPLQVVEDFFGIGRREARHIQLSIITKMGLSQPIDRPVVISQGQNGQRLMRRVEMPQIRDLERPLAVTFLKLTGRSRFAFKLLPKPSADYRIASQLLQQEGQQGNAQRRFLVGRPGDNHWKLVKSLLES